MALFNKVFTGSDDEDDLEFLRLAALQTLKSKNVTPVVNASTDSVKQNTSPKGFRQASFGATQPPRHHGRGFRNGTNRTGRNGMFSRARTNTNLISIQTVETDADDVLKPVEDTKDEMSKLILPQDRYHKIGTTIITTMDVNKELKSNKFDRYDDNSNDSDSDSDGVDGKRKERESSIDRLVFELENEINESDNNVKLENVAENLNSEETKQKCRDKSAVLDENDSVLIIECENELVPDESITGEKKAIEDNKISEPVAHILPSKNNCNVLPEKNELKKSPRSCSRSPLRVRSPLESQRSNYWPIRGSRSPPRKVRYSPPYSRPLSPSYSRRISPLTLNTEVLSTIARAPLSPRSAAFVLQNREILARRKMSPNRRSRSRSPRYSVSPRRQIPSPKNRSRSPWFEPSKKRSLSPRRSRSPRSFSPLRRSSSPRNRPYKRSPDRYLSVNQTVKRKSHSPVLKQPVHRRLGNTRNNSPISKREIKSDVPFTTSKRQNRSLSLSPSPDKNYQKCSINETTGLVKNDSKKTKERIQQKDIPAVHLEKKIDPVLEARKRKFESSLPLEANGIIKLKKDTEKKDILENTEQSLLEMNENLDEIEELDDSFLDLNPTVDDLWSDDETDNENEGRFKSMSKNSQNKKVTYLPFTKLTEKSIPSKDTLSLTKENDRNVRRDRRSRNSRRSKSPQRTNRTNKFSTKLKENKQDPKLQKSQYSHVDIKPKIKASSDNNIVKAAELEIKESRAKENIEKNENVSLADNSRKVKIQKSDVQVEQPPEEEYEPEIIIENDDDDLESRDDGGDLRAELSRRRAQRLIKSGTLSEALPARLLKTALQEVVPKRVSEKHAKTKGNTSSAERRVLILKRLITNPEPELKTNNKASKKDGKLPIHMRLGLTKNMDHSLGELVRNERRSKRSRSGRRKKGVQRFLQEYRVQALRQKKCLKRHVNRRFVTREESRASRRKRRYQRTDFIEWHY